MMSFNLESTVNECYQPLYRVIIKLNSEFLLFFYRSRKPYGIATGWELLYPDLISFKILLFILFLQSTVTNFSCYKFFNISLNQICFTEDEVWVGEESILFQIVQMVAFCIFSMNNYLMIIISAHSTTTRYRRASSWAWPWTRWSTTATFLRANTSTGLGHRRRRNSCWASPSDTRLVKWAKT